MARSPTKATPKSGASPLAPNRLLYALRQGVKVAWYGAHYSWVNRQRGPLNTAAKGHFHPTRPIPHWKTLLSYIQGVFVQDLENIEAGHYRLPADVPTLSSLLARSRRFFRDAIEVDKRRQHHRHNEVRATQTVSKAYPTYYLQNFHYQTDGWLSEHSAKVYDTQVDVLFTGTTDAMRRQALVPISKYMKGKDQRKVRLLDLATGTAPFLKDLKHNWPRLPVTAIDLSPDYLARARQKYRKYKAISFVQGLAERLPVADTSQDILTCFYLFHELPPKIRRQVIGEVARVLKPGGLFVLVDALQFGDRPEIEGLLEFFPHGFHEPYFSSYVEEDFDAICARESLVHESASLSYLTKMIAWKKQ